MTSILKADTIQDTDGNNIINEWIIYGRSVEINC